MLIDQMKCRRKQVQILIDKLKYKSALHEFNVVEMFTIFSVESFIPTAYQVIPANIIWGAYVVPALNYTCAVPEGGQFVDECHYSGPQNSSSVSDCEQWHYDTSTFKYTITQQVRDSS